MSILDANKKLLSDSAALTGRTISEDGTLVNVADMLSATVRVKEYADQVTEAVGVTLVAVATFDVRNQRTLQVQLAATIQPLDQFAIRGQVPGGMAHTLYGEPSDFISPPDGGRILEVFKFVTATGLPAANNDLTTTGDGETASVRLDVGNLATVTVQVACATAGGTVSAVGGGQ